MSASYETQIPINEHLEVVGCEDDKGDEQCFVPAGIQNPVVEDRLNLNTKAREGTPEKFPTLSISFSNNNPATHGDTSCHISKESLDGNNRVTHLAKNEANPPSTKLSCSVLPELSNALCPAKKIIPEYSGPPLLMAKRYIRFHNSAQENGNAEKKLIAEGDTSPNRIPCKQRRSKRLRRVFKGEGWTKEYPTSTAFDYESQTDRVARSQVKKKTWSLKDVYAVTSEITIVDYE